jgi:glycosyltransferase involved in cell wall biosynthesis
VTAAAPTFSVIMPVYNGGRFLRRSIGSVQAQTDQDWELIAIDDGSVDDSLDLLREFSGDDHRIRILQSPRSGGPATPRSIGLREAHGSIACLIDQDDEWLPNKLAMQRAKFATGDFGLVYSDCYVENEGQERFRYSAHWGPMVEGDIAAELIEKDFVPTLTVGVRMALAREIGGFSSKLDGVDDYEYWLRAAFAGASFGRIDEPLAVWHLDDHNMSRRNAARQQIRLYRCYRRLARRYPRYAADLQRSSARARRGLFETGIGDVWLPPSALRSAAALTFAALALARTRQEYAAALSALAKGPPRRYLASRR